jgi:hypothetical protein
MSFDLLPTDLIRLILSNLENIDIIKVLCLSKEYNRLLGKKNLFTSIKFTNTSPFFKTIHNYIEHSQSIRKTTLVSLYDPQHIWPFETEEMVHIDCVTDEVINYSDKVCKLSIKFFKNKIYCFNTKAEVIFLK